MLYFGKGENKKIGGAYTNEKTIEKEKDFYKEKIVEMIERIENPGILEYLHTFIQIFLEKWG